MFNMLEVIETRVLLYVLNIHVKRPTLMTGRIGINKTLLNNSP